MRKVIIKKISACATPQVPSGRWETYKLGSDNGPNVSLPVEYELIGEEANPPTVGKPYSVLRINRNGVDALGLFQTTVVKVVNIIDDICYFETQNSKYTVTEYK